MVVLLLYASSFQISVFKTRARELEIALVELLKVQYQFATNPSFWIWADTLFPHYGGTQGLIL